MNNNKSEKLVDIKSHRKSITAKTNKYLINKITKDDIALQVVLREIPLNLSFIKRGVLNGLSIIRSGEKSFYPISLGLESTTKCNLKCSMCPRTDLLTRNTGNMDFDLYKKIIDEINPVFITLAQLGEPLLHPRIIDMIEYAQKESRVVRITTNATLLNEETARKVIKAKLTHMLISFDSCKKELMERIRPGANFEKVVKNIKTLINLKRELNSELPIISFNVTLNKNNVHEITDLLKFCHTEFEIYPTFTKMYTYGEENRLINSLDKDDLEYIKQGYDYALSTKMHSVYNNLNTVYKEVIHQKTNYRPCFFPYYTTSVTWDGKIYPCCLYFDGQTVFGDMTKNSFSKIWNNEKYKMFREKLREDRGSITICRNCPLVDTGINNILSKNKLIKGMIRVISKRTFRFINKESGLC